MLSRANKNKKPGRIVPYSTVLPRVKLSDKLAINTEPLFTYLNTIQILL